MRVKINFKKTFQLVALVGMPFFIACSHTSENTRAVEEVEFRGVPIQSEASSFRLERSLASFSSDSNAEIGGFPQRLADFKREISDASVFNRKSCENFLLDRNENVFPRSSIELNRILGSGEQEKTEQIENLMSDTQRVRTSISIFMDSNIGVGRACLEQLKLSVRKLRHLEDYLREISVKAATNKDSHENLLAKNQLEINSFQNPIQYDFSAGDIILLKDFDISNTYFAKRNDPRSDFNRVAIVVQNSKRKLFVLESSANNGVSLVPIQYWSSKNIARVFVARSNSSELAENISKSIFAKITDKHGRLDSKFKPAGLAAAAEGQKSLVVFDLIRQSLESAEAPRALLNSIAELSDFEVNPYIFPVFEARNLNALKALRIEGAAVQSILDWQQTKTYQFLIQSDSKSDLDVKSYQQVLGTLMRELQMRDSVRSLESGQPMFDLDLVNLVEQFRVADCRIFKSGGGTASQFHQVFSPRSSRCD